jgi:replicative DNA helicase
LPSHDSDYSPRRKHTTTLADLPPPADKALELCHLISALDKKVIGAQKLHEDVFFYELSKCVARGMKLAAESGEVASMINIKTLMLEAGASQNAAADAADDLLLARQHDLYGHKVENELGRLYERRRLFDAMVTAGIKMRDLSEDTDLLTQQVTSAIEDYQMSNKDKTDYSAHDEACKLARELISDQPIEKGFTTGVIKLDSDTGGYKRKRCHVVMAQSHFGKTSLMCMQALENAKQGVNVLLCTGEDTADMLSENLIVQNSTLSRRQLKTEPKAYAAEIVSSADTLPANIHIFETFGLTPAQISNRATQLIKEHNIDLVFFDYLKVMSGRSRYEDERSQLNETYEALTFTIRRNNVAGVIFSQITENEHARDLKMLVRGSKDVAHRADGIIVGLKNRDGERVLVMAKWKGGYAAAGNDAIYHPASDERRMVFTVQTDNYDFGPMEWNGNL